MTLFSLVMALSSGSQLGDCNACFQSVSSCGRALWVFCVLQCLRLPLPEGAGIGWHGDMGAVFPLACADRKGLKTALDFLFFLSPHGAAVMECPMASSFAL